MFRLISSLNQIHIERNFVIYKKIRFDKSNLQTSSKLLNSNLLLKFSRFFNISKWKAPKIPKIPPLESKKFIFETSSSKDPSQIKKMEWDDPFSWLQNLKDPRVLDYIKKENKYSSKILENFSNLSRELYEEMIKILPKEQRIPPIIHESYVYYAVSYENENFYRYNRREISLNPITNEEEKGEEEVLLDQNEEAKKYGYTDISILKISDDHKYLAYTMDITGNEIYCAFVKHLSSGKIEENEVIPNVVNVEWDKSSSVIYYTIRDSLHRPFQLYSHELGTSKSMDKLIFEESDPSFFLDVTRSKDKNFIFINSNSKTTSEVRILDLNNLEKGPQCVKKREDGVQYFMDHNQNKFFIVTNENAPNFKVAISESDFTNKWETIIPELKNARLEDMDILDDYIVIYEKFDGLPRIRVVDINLQSSHLVELPESVISLRPGVNLNPNSNIIRFFYSSPITPEKFFEYNIKERTLKLIDEYQGNFDNSKFVCSQIKVPTNDPSISIPLTLVHNKSMSLNKQNPVLITGYGSYGQSCSLDFQSENISLLNRGWVLAFSHVRGGGELGTLWHDQGKKLNKKNSFHDFLYCCDYLIEKNYTQPDLLTAYGSSAGGLLVATSCILWKPELFHSIILEVPFVDIVTSMTNSELPLTIHEYEEWGNPKVTEELENILSYDPYFNLKPVLDKTNFPQIFLIGSTADIRVPYWHPVKFAAKLRKILSESPNISNSLVLLQINDDNTGHFGEGGKYSQFIQISRIYSFLIASIQNVIQSKKENQINSKRKYSF